MQERADDRRLTTDNRSLGELFAELSRETSQLVRQEFALAKTEMTEKAREAGAQGAKVAAGGVLAHGALLVFIAAIVIALAQVGVPAWLSALIVAIALAVVAYALAMRGVSRLKQTSFAPRQTIESLESLKEDRTWTTRTKA